MLAVLGHKTIKVIVDGRRKEYVATEAVALTVCDFGERKSMPWAWQQDHAKSGRLARNGMLIRDRHCTSHSRLMLPFRIVRSYKKRGMHSGIVEFIIYTPTKVLEVTSSGAGSLKS